jgi:hypothetical protein
MNAIKPENGDGDFTFSRNSAATRVNAQGIKTGTTSSGLTQSYSFGNAKKYRLEFTILDFVSGSIKGEFSGGGGSDLFFTSNNIGNGTFTFETTTTTNRTTLQFYAFSSFQGSITNISVIEITDDTNLPRIDYTDGCGSWLLEPQSTNLITYSEDFSNAYWINNGATITSNEITSPSGTLTADLLTGTGGGFGLVLFSTWTATNTIATCFAKAGSTNIFKIANASAANRYVLFDLSNGTVFEQSTGWTGFIEYYGNGWYRCTAISNNETGTFSLSVTAASESIYIWGAQLEQSYATSYIPTNGATSTRLADIANNSGNASLINSTEGVLYAEIAALVDDGTQRSIAITDGTVNNIIVIRYNNYLGNSAIDGIYVNNGVLTPAAILYSNSTDFTKIALSYQQGALKLYVNGTLEINVALVVNDAINWNTLQFNIGNGTQKFYGKTKALAVYKTALTDAQLIELTTI